MKRLSYIVVLLSAVAHGEARNELSASAGLDSAYDDNVFNGRGPDFVNRVDPHVSWRLISRRLKVGAAYDVGICDNAHPYLERIQARPAYQAAKDANVPLTPIVPVQQKA